MHRWFRVIDWDRHLSSPFEIVMAPPSELVRANKDTNPCMSNYIVPVDVHRLPRRVGSINLQRCRPEKTARSNIVDSNVTYNPRTAVVLQSLVCKSQ